jgi:hypothetical protein
VESTSGDRRIRKKSYAKPGRCVADDFFRFVIRPPLAHTTKHKTNQGRQRQFAVAREGAGVIGMSCHLVEGGRMQMRNEPGQEF